jgi:hypothetical protein
MLTPGMARISHTTCPMYLNVPKFSCQEDLTPYSGRRGEKTDLPPL